jgi:hypothetical protein
MNILTNYFCLLIEKWQAKILFIIKLLIIILTINLCNKKILRVFLISIKIILKILKNRKISKVKKLTFKIILRILVKKELKIFFQQMKIFKAHKIVKFKIIFKIRNK